MFALSATSIKKAWQKENKCFAKKMLVNNGITVPKAGFVITNYIHKLLVKQCVYITTLFLVKIYLHKGSHVCRTKISLVVVSKDLY